MDDMAGAVSELTIGYLYHHQVLYERYGRGRTFGMYQHCRNDPYGTAGGNDYTLVDSPNLGSEPIAAWSGGEVIRFTTDTISVTCCRLI